MSNLTDINNILATLADKMATLPKVQEYILPVAKENQLGGIQSGGDISVDETGVVTITNAGKAKQIVDEDNEVINIDGPIKLVDGKPEEYDLPKIGNATETEPGLVAIGNGLEINGDGQVSVKADESFVVSDNGISLNTIPVEKGGTGATTAEGAREALGAAPKYEYGTKDLVAGETLLETGKLYFVYV